MSELKPCPFCGNENVAIANECHDLSGGYFVACPACGGSTGLRYACGDDPRPLLIEQWNRRTARSGQAASGSSQGARSDEAVKRFGSKPWSTLARLKDDEDLELYVRARIEAEGVGQPEAPTAAPLPKGWDVIRKDDPLKTIIVIAPNGYSAVTTAMSRNPENVLRMLVEDIAHPPARSGAGSEEGRG